MFIRSQSKAKTLFIYPGSDNPYISIKGIKGEPLQPHNRAPSDSADTSKLPEVTRKPRRQYTMIEQA
jgi:hypothetical protein